MADGHTFIAELPARLQGVDETFPGAIAHAAGTMPYLLGKYPAGYVAPRDLPRGYRPGERILRGKPDCFNLTLLVAYQCDLAVEAAPADLSGWPWEDLCDLHASWLNRVGRGRAHEALTRAVGERVCAERARRPQHLAAFGKVAA